MQLNLNHSYRSMIFFPIEFQIETRLDITTQFTKTNWAVGLNLRLLLLKLPLEEGYSLRALIQPWAMLVDQGLKLPLEEGYSLKALIQPWAMLVDQGRTYSKIQSY